MSNLATTDLLRPVQESLPTMYDLPSERSGEPGMPDEFHPHQAILLSETFHPTTVPPDQFFTAIDLNLYYDSRNPLFYKRPDWFAVIGVPSLYEGREFRLSYVIWQEGVAPLIIVELLSPKTERADLGRVQRDEDGTPTKWEVYEQILRVPYYAVFSRVADRMRIFRLNGGGYTEVAGHGNRFWIPEAGLGLGVWRGVYKGVDRLWLRWYDAQGNWIPTNAERAEQERLHAEQEQLRAEKESQRAEMESQRAEQERLRAEQAQMELARERERAERLAEMLRQLGKDPDRII